MPGEKPNNLPLPRSLVRSTHGGIRERKAPVTEVVRARLFDSFAANFEAITPPDSVTVEREARAKVEREIKELKLKELRGELIRADAVRIANQKHPCEFANHCSK